MRSKKSRLKLLEKYNSKNTKFQLLIRYLVVKSIAKECGDNVYIGKYSVLKSVENLIIGSNVSIHEYCYIECGEGLSIGNNVSIAHRTSIIGDNHSFTICDIPFKYQTMTSSGIKIGDNVWIGAGCIILDGSIINSNVVFGAGSVCTRGEYPSSYLYVGSPAKPKKSLA